MEKIVAAATTYNYGVMSCVFYGQNHGECNQKAKEHGNMFGKPISNIQGFLTTKGRLVDRKEALKLALKCDQVRTCFRKSNEETGLFSEDLLFCCKLNGDVVPRIIETLDYKHDRVMVQYDPKDKLYCGVIFRLYEEIPISGKDLDEVAMEFMSVVDDLNRKEV